jgi:UDPglucose--hexose-1-phosphate uridylyltransferase
MAEEKRKPEIRLDQLTGLRTILAAARADRPFDFGGVATEPDPKAAEKCPFCDGHEDRTPPETWADRPGGGGSDTPGWTVRAVPNLYPALAQSWGPEEDPVAAGAEGGGEDGLTAAGDPLRAASRGREPDLFQALPAWGFHEVIINTPKHKTSLGQLDDGELAAAVAGWRERMRAHSERAAYVQLIVNEGREAGASLEHTHAQLYALGFVPAAVARERERFAAYNQHTMGGDLLAEIAAEEVRRRERLVAIDDEALLICPWASRSPFELRIIPRTPAASFERDGEVGVAMLRTALEALAARFGTVPQFNAWTLSAPRGSDQFHWHIDIAPRIGIRAGFEMSTGVELNVFPPERAAAELREAAS